MNAAESLARGGVWRDARNAGRSGQRMFDQLRAANRRAQAEAEERAKGGPVIAPGAENMRWAASLSGSQAAQEIERVVAEVQGIEREIGLHLFAGMEGVRKLNDYQGVFNALSARLQQSTIQSPHIGGCPLRFSKWWPSGVSLDLFLINHLRELLDLIERGSLSIDDLEK